MIFIYHEDSKYPALTKSKIIWIAYESIIRYKLKADDKILENYLKENYRISLKQACLKLALNAKITYDSSSTYIITFPTTSLKNLAQLITYGTGKILGSPILQRAFKKALDTRR